MSEVAKCKEGEFCPWMDKALQGREESHKVGLHMVLTDDFNAILKGQVRFYFYGASYRWSKKKEDVRFIDYCPFCGGEMSSFRHDPMVGGEHDGWVGRLTQVDPARARDHLDKNIAHRHLASWIRADAILQDKEQVQNLSLDESGVLVLGWLYGAKASGGIEVEAFAKAIRQAAQDEEQERELRDSFEHLCFLGLARTRMVGLATDRKASITPKGCNAFITRRDEQKQVEQ